MIIHGGMGPKQGRKLGDTHTHILGLCSQNTRTLEQLWYIFFYLTRLRLVAKYGPPFYLMVSNIIWRFPKSWGCPPNHPSHSTILVLKSMVTWGFPSLGNLQMCYVKHSETISCVTWCSNGICQKQTPRSMHCCRKRRGRNCSKSKPLQI